jgi:hypothetical protein
MLVLFLVAGLLLFGVSLWRLRSCRARSLILLAKSKTHYLALREEWPILAEDKVLCFGPAGCHGATTVQLITQLGTSKPVCTILREKFESPLIEWDPSCLVLRLKRGVDLSSITYLSVERARSEFIVFFCGLLEYRDGDKCSVPIFNLSMDNLIIPHRAPGRPLLSARVQLLYDARLEAFLSQHREDVADGLMAFGCDAHLLSQAEHPQKELCSLIRSIVEKNASIIWAHRDPRQIRLQDSSMFNLCHSSPSSFSSPQLAPPMHAVRQIGAYAPQLHLDVNVADLSPEEELRDHINVWLPLDFSPQDPLVFLSRHTGAPVYASSPGNFTHFERGDDRGVGAFLRPGEMLVWCPLLIPHSACNIPGRGPSTRRSAEFRFQCVSVNS